MFKFSVTYFSAYIIVQEVFFFSGKSDGDPCALFSDRTLINRRNVKGDPSAAYRADRDFPTLVVKSRVTSAAVTVLGFESKTSIIQLTFPFHTT